MSKLSKALIAAAGNAGAGALYVEDVFSTYLYTGDGTSDPFPIVNGIDLANNGGLVWQKQRSSPSQGHILVDTERGGSSFLSSNTTSAATSLDMIDSFNEDGFDFAFNTITNGNGINYASWTFRKAEKFFDVVTYTGDGVAGRTVAHNLEVAPAFIIIKCTSTPTNWPTYHASDDGFGFGDENTNMYLNLTVATQAGSSLWNGTAPTSTEFTVGSTLLVNGSGETYVAYLFASDAGGFGDDGSENIIKCGSYTGTGTAGLEIDLGFEPQWLLIKNADRSISWHLTDSMRGLNLTSRSELYPNLSNAEWTGSPAIVSPTATGFVLGGANTYTNFSGENFIYIAIRRPMKTPESGTEVFAVAPRSNTASADYAFVSNFPVDMGMARNVIGSTEMNLGSRMTGDYYLQTPNTNAEATVSSWGGWDSMNSASLGFSKSAEFPVEKYAWMFKRATGFFDVVAYTGDGVTNRQIAHNLGVQPELMIMKERSGVNNWNVFLGPLSSDGDVKIARVNRDNASFADTTNTFSSFFYDKLPTSSVFTIGDASQINASGDTYIAYLFASVAGVSKVFSVTKSSGSNANVDCGFSAGARFILLKRTDSTGDWYVWDSVRGIVSGNDPYLLLNSTAAEVTTTDYIDPLASGFTIVDGGLANGDYIGLAIA